MSQVPTEERFGLRERRQVLAVNKALDGDRAKIGYHKFCTRFERFRRRGVEAVGKSRGILPQPDENRFCRCAQFLGVRQRENRIVDVRTPAQCHHLSPDQIGASIRSMAESGEGRIVGTGCGGALDQACGIAKTRLGTEIETSGHAGAPTRQRTWHAEPGDAIRAPCNCARREPQLAFSLIAADIKGGRLAVDEPLANRVRSGRKQP